jgi:hypothetical protein
MGFEKSHLFGKIEIDIAATASGTFSLSTDIPGGAGMGQRFSFTIPITARRPVSSRLPGAMQGHYVSAKYVPGAGQSELYGVRVWTRQLPDGQWGWSALPVIDTPLEFQPMQVPVEPTPASFSPVSVPVEPTPESYSPVGVPVEPTPVGFSPVGVPVEPTAETYSPMQVPVESTPAEFSPMKLPVEPTAEGFSAMSIPVEETPEKFSSMSIPVEPTPNEFSGMKLPVKATPPVPIWTSVGVDE